MKEVDKKRTPNNNNRTKQKSGKIERKDPKLGLGNNGKTSNVKEAQSKAPRAAKMESRTLVSDSNTGTEQSEVYENVVIHYVDDVNRSEEAGPDQKGSQSTSIESMDDNYGELDKESKQGKDEVSDSEMIKDSVSSHGDSVSVTAEEEKAEESGVKDDSMENDSEESKETPDQPKETDTLNEISSGDQSIGSDDESEQISEHENDADTKKKIEQMEARIEKLEGELQEVAALEISLYSVVPEHGSSAHKVHTPARRLSRLYIHAGKYWSPERRATVAKNTVSGLLLVAKSCGNDVARLTFWLSNTVVLREIVYQAFGGSRHASTHLTESNGNGKKIDANSSTLKWKGTPGIKQFSDDWQQTGTFTAALEKVEYWIFCRVVKSVWWQALTPHMQSPVDDASNSKNMGRLLGPSLGDQNQGNFSINLWKKAFHDAAQRLCPVRAGGHECGCLPVLSRMLMEQCIARLDVAMFNAILRESAHEIPTDPESDPIVDSKVLPISAGDLSFGSGAQLKNSIGNWSRWLTDMFGIDADDVPREDDEQGDDSDILGGNCESKTFVLLNSLSDLLMLPKDMLMDRSIRKEVCPLISLPLIKRILCNFTPDEFCPDPVPGTVLEALNAESIVECRMSGDSVRNFPYTVAPVVYSLPSPAEVAAKCAVSDSGEKSKLGRNVSIVQRKGYTSDDELEELESPLMSIIDKLPSSPNVTANGKHVENACYVSTNERYKLLSEVWSV